MPLDPINISQPNDNQGDPIRVALDKANKNDQFLLQKAAQDLAAERQAREQSEAATSSALGAQDVRLTAVEARSVGAASNTPQRPGETGLATTALTGPLEAAFQNLVNPGWKVDDPQMGASIEIAGGSVPISGSLTLARVDPIPLEEGHVYRGVWAVRRTVDGGAMDRVERGLRVLAYDKSGMPGITGTRIVSDTVPTVVGGVETVTRYFAFDAGDTIDFILPAGARYARPFTTIYGRTGTTRVALLTFEDITDKVTGGADVTDLYGRVSATESGLAGEAAARAAAVAGEASARSTAVARVERTGLRPTGASRPGVDPKRWRTGALGLPSASTVYADTDIDTSLGYPVLRVSGHLAAVAPMEMFVIDPAAYYLVDMAAARLIDPASPSTDPLRFGAYFVDQSGVSQGFWVEDVLNVTTASGEVRRQYLIGPTAVAGFTRIVVPSGALFVPYVQGHGVGQAIGAAEIQFRNITDAIPGIVAQPVVAENAAQVSGAKGSKATVNDRIEADRLADAQRGQRGPQHKLTLRNWRTATRKTFAEQVVNRLVSLFIAPKDGNHREKIDSVLSELNHGYAGGLLFKLAPGALWDKTGRHMMARIDRLGRTLVTGAGRLGAPVVHSLETPRWYATSPGTSLTGARTRALINDPNAIAYFPAKGQSFLFGGAAADMGTAVFSAGVIAAGKALMPKQTTGKRIWVDSDSVFTEFEDMAGGTGYENPPGTRILGESPIYEMVRHWLAACQTHFGYQPQTLATIAGAGGQTVMQVVPGTQNWIEWESGIVQSRDAARRLKKRLWIVAIPLVFGQSMFNYLSSFPDLKQAIYRYAFGLQTRAMYLTGEYEHRPPVLVAPITRAVANTLVAPFVRPDLNSWNRAIQELCEEHPSLFVNYGAGYGWEMASDEHRTVLGYRQEGKALGIAAENAVLSTGHTDFCITDVLRTGATTLRCLLYTGDGSAPVLMAPGTETGGIGNPSDTGAANYIGPASGKYAKCAGFQAVDATAPSTTNEDFIGVESATLGAGTYESQPYLDLQLSREPLGSTGILLVGAQGQTTSIQGVNADTARTALHTAAVVTIDDGLGGTIRVLKVLSPGRFRIPAL